MPRISAEPPKDPQKRKAAAAEEKYVNQAAQPKNKTENIQQKNLYKDKERKR